MLFLRDRIPYIDLAQLGYRPGYTMTPKVTLTLNIVYGVGNQILRKKGRISKTIKVRPLADFRLSPISNF